MKQPELINDEIYHICYRAVGDSIIFSDMDDYYRGIFSLYEFNHCKPVSIFKRRVQRISEKARRGQTSSESSDVMLERRELMVEIMTFAFMPNHIHILLKQVKDNGITNFMRKVGTGYASYFNKKYKRKGHLFNTFKSFHIENNDQLKNTVTYIHCNPLSLIEPGWKEKGIQNFEKSIHFLESEYKWSSYWDCIGKKNFPSVTDRKFILEVMEDESGCRTAVNDWVRYKKTTNDLDDIFLE